MCTVTFVPETDGTFTLRSNRDEQAWRSSPEWKTLQAGWKQVFYPQDQGAGGSWIACSTSGQLICLLNGAFEKHTRIPPYRRSRGLMVLDYFYFPDTLAFCRQYTFEGMEPFTLVIWDNGHLYDIRWDANTLHLNKRIPKQPHLWSSATLYDATMQQQRQTWFAEWLETDKNLLDFHCRGCGKDPWYDIRMKRPEVETVSVTQVQVSPGGDMEIFFTDIQSGQGYENRIKKS